MSKKKKIGLVLFMITLCLLGIFLLDLAVSAKGLIGEDTGGTYLYNKYPIENYKLDSYVDTSGNWMPWNWGKAMDDGSYSLLAWLIGCVYAAIFKGFHIIGYFVQAVYSTDVINPLMEVTVQFIQGIAGFNGSFLDNGLFSQLLATVVILTGLYYGFQIIKKESGRTIGGLAMFGLLVVVSLGFFAKADTFIRGANDIANSIQTVVVKAGTHAMGMKDDPAAAIREGFFDITVYQPYLLLQYNDTSVSAEKAGEILSLESGSEEREELVKKEVEEHGNKMMNGWYGLDLRVSNMLPLILSGAVLAVVILMLVCINIYHQFLFVLYACVSPFILILSLLPNKSGMAIQLGAKLVYELCMRIGLAMLLCLMYGFSAAIYKLTGAEGYVYGAVLQAIVYVAVFLFRKKIYGLFMEGGKPAGGKGGLRSTLGSLFMENRGFKALGMMMGGKRNPLPRRAKTAKQPQYAQSDLTKRIGTTANKAQKLSGGRQLGLPDKVIYGTCAPDAGKLAEGNKNSLAKRPRRRQMPASKKQVGNIRYKVAVPTSRMNRHVSKGNLARYRKDGSRPEISEKGMRHRNDPSSQASYVRRKSRLQMSQGQYKTADREKVPYVQKSKWQKGQNMDRTLTKRNTKLQSESKSQGEQNSKSSQGSYVGRRNQPADSRNTQTDEKETSKPYVRRKTGSVLSEKPNIYRRSKGSRPRRTWDSKKNK